MKGSNEGEKDLLRDSLMDEFGGVLDKDYDPFLLRTPVSFLRA